MPNLCSAFALFAEACTNGFYAILRKRMASLMRRARVSSSSFLKVLQTLLLNTEPQDEADWKGLKFPQTKTSLSNQDTSHCWARERDP